MTYVILMLSKRSVRKMEIINRIRELLDTRKGYVDLGDKYDRSEGIVNKADIIRHFFKER